MSTLSLTMKSLHISSAYPRMSLACSSISLPSAFFILSWTTSAPPSKANLATSASVRPFESWLSVTTYRSNMRSPSRGSDLNIGVVVSGVSCFGMSGSRNILDG